MDIPFLGGDVLVLRLAGFVCLGLFDLLECLVVSLALALEIKILTARLLEPGYRYHRLREAFSKFYRRHYDFVSGFNTGQSLSEPEFLWRLGVQI